MYPNYFLYLLIPPRPTFVNDATPDELATMGRHAQYLMAGRDSGLVLMAGPTLDGAWGGGVLKTGDAAVAEDFAANDPAVTSGLMRYQLHPWRASIRADGL